MRSDLRLGDLNIGAAPSKLMNVKVPGHVADALDLVVSEMGCTKTALVIALLNEGLDAFEERRDEFPTTSRGTRVRRGRPPKVDRAKK